MDKNFETAIRMLGRKGYHSLELAKKLKEKGISQPEVADVVEKLQKMGYLDDEAWENSYIDGFVRKGRGSGALGYYLHAKGLLSLLPKLKERVQEGEKASLEAEIKKFRGDLEDTREKQRLFQRLQRRGFNIELILSVL